jgi:hypothetical protein
VRRSRSGGGGGVALQGLQCDVFYIIVTIQDIIYHSLYMG